jgi:hypothetical protein
MAHVFKIMDLTTALVDFMDSTHGIVAYEPGYGYGERITETATIRVSAASDSGLSDAIDTINNAFSLAEYRANNGVHRPVYLYYSPSGADTGQSILYGGRITSVMETLGPKWAGLDFDVSIEFTRDNWWEDPTQFADCNMANKNGTVPTPSYYIAVYNNNDRGGSTASLTFHNNFLYTTGTIIGDLPAPIDLEIVPRSGKKIAALYITQFFEDSSILNSSSYPASLGWFEGEDASTAADSTGVAFSGSKYHAFAVSTGSVGTNIEWDVSTSFFSSAQNHILCGAKFTGTVRVKPYVNVNGTKSYGKMTILTGTNAWNIYDVGLMRVPPADYIGANNYQSLKSGINVVCTAGTTFNLDWFQSVPVESMMYTHVTESFGLGSTDAAVRRVLTIQTLYGKRVARVNLGQGTGKTYGKASVNGHIMFHPGKKNYLFFKWTDEAGVDNPQDSATINVNYRPRWRFFHAS